MNASGLSLSSIMNSFIEISNLKKIFGTGENAVHAFGPINLNIKDGEFISFLGPSGCGKSTLMLMLAGLLSTTTGHVEIGGKKVTTPKTDIGIMFQDSTLVPWRTIRGNIELQLEMRGEKIENYRDHISELLHSVRIEDFADRFPSELSGGMQQRVGLARALATDPQILLMDEAFSALDPLIRSDMQNQLVDLQSKLKKTIVFITHDLDESLKLGDHIGILNGGRLVQVGRPEDIIMNPADDYVKAFVKDVNRSKVLRAKTVMTKIDKFDASTINASSTYKYDEDTFIEDLVPKVLKDRSTIEVIDKTGNTTGYISSDELSVALTKTT